MICKIGFQGLEIIRGCRGLNLVGCDLVEVAPAYDTTGTVLNCLHCHKEGNTLLMRFF